MRKLLLITVLCLSVSFCRSQDKYVDSLLQIMEKPRDREQRVISARLYNLHYAFKPADTVAYYGNRLFLRGQKCKSFEMQAIGKGMVAFSHTLKNETYKALEANIEALKLAERAPHRYVMGFVYNGYGIIYSSLDNRRAIEYYKLAYASVADDTARIAISGKRSVLNNIAIRFNESGHFDSAIRYAQQALELSRQAKDNVRAGNGALGLAYLRSGQPQLAYAFFLEALRTAYENNEKRILRAAHTSLATYHFETGNSDSAVYYTQKAFSYNDDSGGPSWLISPALNMYKIYKQRGNANEALKYLEIHSEAKQQVDSLQQLKRSQILAFEEDQRQDEILAQKNKEAQSRVHNLQYAGIALGMLGLLLLFVLFSRSIIAKPNLIRFLGVIALLIVFEFINLLIHPFIGELTHHSPVYMLLIMVCIAAMLVPMHHKIEHAVIHKLVEKNNRIRLAAARKTIAQLEPETTDQ